MAKNTKQSWTTVTHKESGIKMLLPLNRAARRAYRHEQGDLALLPPVLHPYTKPKPFGILDAEDTSDAVEKGKVKKSNKL